jgi:Flp pilus assembly protein TadG
VDRRSPGGERGSAVVDFVLVLLVLLPLVLGILQLALVLHVRNTLASAAAEGARHAAVAGSSAGAGAAKVQELVDGALSADFARSVVVRPATVGGAAGFEAVVEADVEVLGLGGPGIRVRVEGHAVAEQAAGQP